MSILTPSRFGSFDEKSSFELPIPGLLADIDTGAGSVRMTDEFLEAPATLRTRLLQEWLRGLQALRDAAVVEMFRESSIDRPSLSIVDQIDAFRTQCHHEGITCPGDLAVLLQRY